MKTSLLVLTLLTFLMVSCVPVQEKLPNIVVFVVDDLGYMDIGANNPDSFYETPHIDALAKSGMLFTDGYAANPVCSPTRYSLLTGKYPTRVGATNFFPKNKTQTMRSGNYKPAAFLREMPAAEMILPEILKQQDYATFFAGKWHLGHTEDLYPQAQGFDINIGGWHYGGPYSGKKYFAPFENPQMAESPDGEHLPNRLAREAVAFMEKNKDKPFLAYLSFYSVHTPLMGRPDLVNKYKEMALAINGAEFAGEEQVFGKKERKVRILQKHAVYAAMVEAMDEAVGKVLKGLEDSGLSDNTIVVFTSDNGGLSSSEGSPTSNLPLRGGKGWTYEGGIREPWIIRYPGVTKPGAISSEPICSIDLLPTLAAAAEIEVEQVIDGLDLKPVLAGGTLNRESLYWHYPHYSNQGGIPSGAVRQGDFKLIERYEDGSVRLYNLANDIAEQQDLSLEMPDRVNQMRADLHAWYKEMGAKFLEPKGDNTKPWRP